MAAVNPKVILSFKKGDKGESAYQIAVRNGFNGNERQWLDSLKGTDGITHPAPLNGITPVKNIDYFDGREVEFRVVNSYIQWRYKDTGVWVNLLPLSAIKGEPGKTPRKGVDYVDGIDGIDGDDGKPVQLQTTTTHLQWRILGDSDWSNLLDITEIQGEAGRSVELQKDSTHIRWRNTGESEWNNLIAIAEIKGDPSNVPGPTGTTDFAALSNKPTQLADINSTEGSKLAGIDEEANNYIHPENHSPSIITQDTNNRFVTDAEKSAWNGKQPAGSYLVAGDIAGKADISLSIAMAVAL